jgi:hypothetical protein
MDPLVAAVAGIAGGLAASMAAVVVIATAQEATNIGHRHRQPRRRRRQKHFRYRRREWSLRRWDEETCQIHRRFSKEEIRRLVDLFGVNLCPWTNRYTPDNELALCLLLKRLAYPGRLIDIASLFGRSPHGVQRSSTTLLSSFSKDSVPYSNGTLNLTTTTALLALLSRFRISLSKGGEGSEAL